MSEELISIRDDGGILLSGKRGMMIYRARRSMANALRVELEQLPAFYPQYTDIADALAVTILNFSYSSPYFESRARLVLAENADSPGRFLPAPDNLTFWAPPSDFGYAPARALPAPQMPYPAAPSKSLPIAVASPQAVPVAGLP
ncbi:hypothetical protein [Aquisphaera insulae]|uniref:hypothetical protein n=1 Tax=Aquisphaera insulae TaxID=2712864 RepID=UPI0013E9BF40|nr:hypothetical protein [Aquisphaera insulae]